MNLADFLPFPKCSDRESWSTIPDYLRDYIMQEASKTEKVIKSAQGWPQLLASDYMQFCLNGDRVSFENKYFSRRNYLTLLALAECIEGKGRLLPLIADGVLLLCQESGWQLPAHNSYARDVAQEPLPDTSRPVIDLFAAETGAQLAVIYYLLKRELDTLSPEICRRIFRELKNRILTPYLNCHFWWMGNGEEEMCNWTPWITQNVLLAFFLLPADKAERREAVKKAQYGLQCFLKDYGQDGCCSEGAEYYRKAALCLYNSADIIVCVTGGDGADFFEQPKIRNMAEYIVNMHIPNSPYYFNFADCAPLAGRSGVREYLFGKKINSRVLCDFAAAEWAASSTAEKLLCCSAESLDGNNIYYLLQSLFTARELDALAKSDRNAEKNDDKFSFYYKSVGIYVMRRGEYSLAVKTGCNADSHNHNDTGSFILYRNGKPFVIDVGVGTYTAKTFSKDRYDIWTMQSSYHNLPEINGQQQCAGKEFCSDSVQIQGMTITQNISRAYPEQAGLKSYTRLVECRSNSVYIKDSAECSGSLVMNLMFAQKPEIGNDFIQIGNTGRLRLPDLDVQKSIYIEEIEIEDKRLRKTWPAKLYRLRIAFSSELELVFSAE